MDHQGGSATSITDQSLDTESDAPDFRIRYYSELSPAAQREFERNITEEQGFTLADDSGGDDAPAVQPHPTIDLSAEILPENSLGLSVPSPPHPQAANDVGNMDEPLPSDPGPRPLDVGPPPVRFVHDHIAGSSNAGSSTVGHHRQHTQPAPPRAITFPYIDHRRPARPISTYPASSTVAGPSTGGQIACEDVFPIFNDPPRRKRRALQEDDDDYVYQPPSRGARPKKRARR